MRLEEIIEMYGWNDWFEQSSGRIFKLSEAFNTEKGAIVPVIDTLDGELIGHVTVDIQKPGGR